MAKTKAETVRELAKAIEIYQIYFTAFDAERQVIDQAPRECSVEVAFGADARVTSPTTFEALVTFQLAAKGADDAPILKLRCQPCVKYRVPAGVSLKSEAVRAFAETNGVFHAWPYCREFAQSTAARLGLLLSLTLPPLKVGQLLAGEAPRGQGGTKGRGSDRRATR